MRIVAIVLTKDEERHIARCLASLRAIVDDVFVVDSGSVDNTRSIAEAMGARVVSHDWRNYSTQLNWALDNIQVEADWILRVDADEYLHENAKGLRAALEAMPAGVSGVCIRRQVHFLGKWIRFGGMYPVWHVRIWRLARGRCEERWMDEHIVVDGQTVQLQMDVVDANQNSLTWWTAKHNSYASREAVDLLMIRYPSLRARQDGPSITRRSQAGVKRMIKERVYSRLPLMVRAAAYFAVRYFGQLGFLDGYQGFIFNVLQAFWYRFLVDAKIYEVERECCESGLSIEVAIRERLGIAI